MVTRTTAVACIISAFVAVIRTCGARSGEGIAGAGEVNTIAVFRHITGIDRGTAFGGDWFERVGRAIRTAAGAEFGDVAITGGRTALRGIRCEAVGRTIGTGTGAGFGQITIAGRCAAFRGAGLKSIDRTIDRCTIA